jgi:hypothetical protein
MNLGAQDSVTPEQVASRIRELTVAAAKAYAHSMGWPMECFDHQPAMYGSYTNSTRMGQATNMVLGYYSGTPDEVVFVCLLDRGSQGWQTGRICGRQGEMSVENLNYRSFYVRGDQVVLVSEQCS